MQSAVSPRGLQMHCSAQMCEQAQTLVEIRAAFDEQPRAGYAPGDEGLTL